MRRALVRSHAAPAHVSHKLPAVLARRRRRRQLLAGGLLCVIVLLMVGSIAFVTRHAVRGSRHQGVELPLQQQKEGDGEDINDADGVERRAREAEEREILRRRRVADGEERNKRQESLRRRQEEEEEQQRGIEMVTGTRTPPTTTTTTTTTTTVAPPSIAPTTAVPAAAGDGGERRTSTPELSSFIDVRLLPRLGAMETGAAARDGDEDAGLTPGSPHRRRQRSPVAAGGGGAVGGGGGEGTRKGVDLRIAAADAVSPLRKVRVELIRQRVNRRTWWQQQPRVREGGVVGGGGAVEDPLLPSQCDFSEPIVALRGPSLPLTHFFPTEVLVEEWRAGDEGPVAKPDPLYRFPVVAAISSSSGNDTAPAATAAPSVTARVFTPLMGPCGGDSEASPILQFHQRQSAPRGGADAGKTDGRRDADAPVEMYWAPRRGPTRPPPPVEIAMYTIHPSRSGDAAREGGGEEEKGRERERGEADPSRTTSLAGTFVFTRLRRLYGLPRPSGSSGSFSSGGGPPPTANAGPPPPHSPFSGFRIPRDGFRMTATVAGRDVRGYSPLPGVVPLVFAELEDSPAGEDGAVAADDGPHREAVHTVGILWLSAAPFIVTTATEETVNDDAAAEGAAEGAPRTTVAFSSSAAETRCYLLPGPTHADVLRQYYTLTGFPALPPRQALGYHHHFRSAPPPLLAVNARFLNLSLPVDSFGVTGAVAQQRGVPFTWAKAVLPEPLQLQAELWLRGRRGFFVRATPHLPVVQSSPLLHEGKRHRYLVSTDPDGDAWLVSFPREALAAPMAEVFKHRTHLVDFINPAARRWYGGMLKYRRFSHSTNLTGIVLAAPAPDTAVASDGHTLPMTAGHHRGTVNRQVHNAYGFHYTMAAYHGLMRRSQYHRRAYVPVEGGFFPGAQRFGAVPLVDPVLPPSPPNNPLLAEAPWRRLRATVEEVVALGMSGLPMAAANAAGFEADLLSGDSSDTAAAAELVARWFQAAAIFPFMRAEEEGRSGLATAASAPPEADAGEQRQRQSSAFPPLSSASALRHLWGSAAAQSAVRLRYSLLPYLYTTLWRTSDDGTPFLTAPPPTANLRGGGDGGSDSAAAAVCVGVGARLIACPIVQPTMPVSSTEQQYEQQEQQQQQPRRDGALSFTLPPPPPPLPSSCRGAQQTAAGDSSPRRDVHNGSGVDCVVSAGEEGLYDIHTGRFYSYGSTAHTPASGGGSASSQLPLFARTGSIVPMFASVGEGRHSDDAASRVLSDFTSSHTPSNFTLVIALRPNLRRILQAHRQGRYGVGGSDAALTVAEGEIFWDEGTENSQVAPPPRNNNGNAAVDADADADEGQRARARLLHREAKFCYARLRLRLSADGQQLILAVDPLARRGATAAEEDEEGEEDARGRCLAALRAVEESWNTVPQQVVADLRQRQAQAQEEEREAERRRRDEADRGNTARRNANTGREDGANLHPSPDAAPLPPHARVPFTKHNTLQLRSLRFLAATDGDAETIAALLQRAEPSRAAALFENVRLQRARDHDGATAGEAAAGGGGSVGGAVVEADVVSPLHLFGLQPQRSGGAVEAGAELHLQLQPWQLAVGPGAQNAVGAPPVGGG